MSQVFHVKTAYYMLSLLRLALYASAKPGGASSSAYGSIVRYRKSGLYLSRSCNHAAVYLAVRASDCGCALEFGRAGILGWYTDRCVNNGIKMLVSGR